MVIASSLVAVAAIVAVGVVLATRGSDGTATSGSVPLVSVSCPSAALCIAADSGGRMLSSVAPRDNPPHWQITELHDQINALACPSTGLCVAVDSDGNVLTSPDPAGGAPSWSNPAGIDPPDGLGPVALQGLSCPTVSLCVAEDGVNLFASTDPGGGVPAWHAGVAAAGSGLINGVNCPSTLLCIAFDGAGNVITSTHPTGGARAWTAARIDPPANGGIYGVACSPRLLCVAADWSGHVITTTDPAGGAAAWSAPVRIDPAGFRPNAIACPGRSLCLAADADGRVVDSVNPGGGAATWSAPAPITGGGRIQSLSCPSAALCVAVDDAGHVLTSAHPEQGVGAWSTATIDPGGVTSTPASMVFASRAAGTASPAQILTFGGVGTQERHLSAVTITGPQAKEFSVVHDRCHDVTVSSQSACAIWLRFKPTSVGAATAALQWSGQPGSVALSGAGVSPVVPAPSLIWSDNPPAGATHASLARADTDGSLVAEAALDLPATPQAMTQDAQHVLWVDNRSIARANLDGTGVEPRFIADVGASQLGLDSAHVYWLGPGGVVGRANLDGTGVQRSYLRLPAGAGGTPPSYLAVSGGYLYWGYHQSPALTNVAPIGRVSVSGTGLQPAFLRPRVPNCVNTTRPAPEGEQCTIDGLAATGSYIFWSWSRVLTAVGPFGSGIGRASTDGTGVVDGLTQVTPPTDSSASIALAADAQFLFWTTGRGIGAASLDGAHLNSGFITDPDVSGLGLAVSPAGPQLLATQPRDGATAVAPSGNVVAEFSTPMNRTAAARALSIVDDTTGQSVSGHVTWFAGRALIFHPATALAVGHRYTAHIAATATAATGTAPANPLVWSFRVAAG